MRSLIFWMSTAPVGLATPVAHAAEVFLMQVPGIRGDVTLAGYAGWILVSHLPTPERMMDAAESHSQYHSTVALTRSRSEHSTTVEENHSEACLTSGCWPLFNYGLEVWPCSLSVFAKTQIQRKLGVPTSTAGAAKLVLYRCPSL